MPRAWISEGPIDFRARAGDSITMGGDVLGGYGLELRSGVVSLSAEKGGTIDSAGTVWMRPSPNYWRYVAPDFTVSAGAATSNLAGGSIKVGGDLKLDARTGANGLGFGESGAATVTLGAGSSVDVAGSLLVMAYALAGSAGGGNVGAFGLQLRRRGNGRIWRRRALGRGGGQHTQGRGYPRRSQRARLRRRLQLLASGKPQGSDSRNGLKVGALTMTGAPDGHTIVVINGTIGTSSGSDAALKVTLTNPVATGSSFNGCAFAAAAICGLMTPPAPAITAPGSLQSGLSAQLGGIDDDRDRNEDPKDEVEDGVADGKGDKPVVDLHAIEHSEGQPSLDDPVTSAGNEDLWQKPQQDRVSRLDHGRRAWACAAACPIPPPPPPRCGSTIR